MSEEGESPNGPGTANRKKQPRWVHSFLRALERCGDARASAADAGIDHTTAYARRRAHPDFAAAWVEALAVHKLRTARLEAEELEAFNASLDSVPPRPGPLPHGEREELSLSNGQVKRVGHDRWSKRKEKIFSDELAATNNVRRSAAAAGVSYNAVLARRLKHSLFRAKWEAVVQCAKAGIGMFVLEASKETFDPETLNLSDAMPKVTIAEAIRISESKPAKGQAEAPATNPFTEPEVSYEDEMADIREGLVRKLQALRRRDRPGLLARGWSYDESWDRDIPPGWVKGPDWRPMQPGDEY